MSEAQSLPLAHAAAIGAVGLALTFMGYRLMRTAVRVFAGLFLATAGFMLAAQTQNPWIIGGVSIGAGILGFAIGDAFYWLFVALFGAAAGAALSGGIAHAAGMQSPHAAVLVAGAGLGIALAVLAQRPFAIFATAANGASAVAVGLSGVLTATGVHGPGRFPVGYLMLLLGLLVAGCVVQAKTTKNLPDPKKSAPGTQTQA